MRPQMGLQGLLLLSLLIFSHSLSCYSNLEELDRRADAPSQSPRPTYRVTSDGNSTAIGYGPEGSIAEASDEPVISPGGSERVVNVMDYGARGDGTDDRKAFERAWDEACSSPVSTVLLVPEGRSYLLKPVAFSGPCKSHVTVMIKGTLEASSNRSDWDDNHRRHWIIFKGIGDLAVGGGGTLDGKGKIWWQNSCKINRSLPCIPAPTALTFYACNDLRVEELKVKDSQQVHVLIEQCRNVEVSKLTIAAPATSPNTDGIHVTGTEKLLITDCVIRTGDDCISIVTGSRRVIGMNIVCGPGHGIRSENLSNFNLLLISSDLCEGHHIGSLGANNSVAHVSDVMMDTVVLNGTTNGVRIKTWQGGHGFVKNIVFQNIQMHDVQNPIIIDQNYCDSEQPCHEQKSAVTVSNVLYKNIRGTSSSKVATTFDCSKSAPCQGIVLQDIDLVGEHTQGTKSLCQHVKLAKIGKVVPMPCL